MFLGYSAPITGGRHAHHQIHQPFFFTNFARIPSKIVKNRHFDLTFAVKYRILTAVSGGDTATFHDLLGRIGHLQGAIHIAPARRQNAGDSRRIQMKYILEKRILRESGSYQLRQLYVSKQSVFYRLYDVVFIYCGYFRGELLCSFADLRDAQEWWLTGRRRRG